MRPTILLWAALAACTATQPTDSAGSLPDSGETGSATLDETGDSGRGPGFDLCAWLDEHTPTTIAAGDEVVVYCQSTTACLESERRVTTEATLVAAEEACVDSDPAELAEWERLAGACPADDTAAPAADAVRCWRLD